MTDLKHVQVSVVFLRFGEIDTLNEKFQAEVMVQSKWVDPDDKMTKYDPNDTNIWNPKLFIENMISIAKPEIIEYNIVKEEGKTVVIETRHANGVFWERLELQSFPLDVQELSVRLSSKLKPTEIKLIPDSLSKSCLDLPKAQDTFMEMQKWKLYNHVLVNENVSFDEMKNIQKSKDKDNLLKNIFNSKLVASCYVSRKPGYYLKNAYFLIFLITGIGLAVFSIQVRLNTNVSFNRLQDTFYLLLTSVQFKW